MSKNILVINSSPMNEKSISRGLVNELVIRIKNKGRDFNFIDRDLSKNPVPHLDASTITASHNTNITQEQKMNSNIEISDELTHELINADVIIIGSPMWNFSIPSVLKAWMDNIIRVNLTFKYGENGIPEGLLGKYNKKLIIVSSRGGVYSEGPYKPFDHQETLLSEIFGWIGITDVSYIRSEGLRGENAIKDAINMNSENINNIVKSV